VAEIEQAIARLPRKQFLQFERWFDEERNRQWDRQIVADARSGKLRKAYERLQPENQGQPRQATRSRLTPLPRLGPE
jgi:hypothetical protein